MRTDPPSKPALGALSALSLPTLMASLDTSIANSALPTLAEAFGASFHSVQAVVLAYLVALTGSILATGRLGDRLGHRRLLLAGIALFTASSLACGLAPNLDALVISRAIQGLGAAAMLSLSLASVGALSTDSARGRVIGLLGTLSAIGTALGPSLGGLSISIASWRAIFLVQVPVGAITLWLAHRHIPADPVAVRNAAPLLDLAVLRDRALDVSLGTTVLVSAVIMSTLVVGPFYLSHALGLSPAVAGTALSVGPLVVALSGVPAGWLVDRLGPRRVGRAGLAGMALAALALALLPARLGLPGYLVPLASLTASYALFQTSNQSAVMTRAAADQRGVRSGLLHLSRNLGLIGGAWLLGEVFARGAGTPHLEQAGAQAVGAGMRLTFAVAAGLMTVALFASTAVPSDSGSRGSNTPHP